MLRRPLPSLMALLLLMGVLSGCLADDGDADDEKNTGPGGERDQKPARGSLSGIVLGVDGPLEGAQVELSRVYRLEQTGGDGSFRFDDLLATDYRLTVLADHHRRYSTLVTVERDVELTVELDPLMLTETVPAMYGKQFVAVNEQDTLFTSAGLPLLDRQQAFTNKTLENTFAGFWEIVPEEGYRVAQISVVLAWAQLPELEQGLALHYFRGESLAENEIVEGAATQYHVPEPSIDGSAFALYTIQNEEWETWGKRNWQLGAFVKEGEHPVAAGAVVEHIISVVVTLVDDAYTPSS